MPVMRPHKLTLPPDAPGAGLLERLEPYLWVDQVTPVQFWGTSPRTAGRGGRWLEVTGLAKPQGEWPAELPAFGDQEAVWIFANSIRAHLFGVAQTAICAAEDAGYTHERHPQIEITGNLRHDRESGLDIPRSECTVRMWLREVARP